MEEVIEGETAGGGGLAGTGQPTTFNGDVEDKSWI